MGLNARVIGRRVIVGGTQILTPQQAIEAGKRLIAWGEAQLVTNIGEVPATVVEETAA